MNQMIFSHDTELTLRAACVLVNSDRVEGEQLGEMAALNAYLDGFGWTGRRDHHAAELASIHRLRDRTLPSWRASTGYVIGSARSGTRRTTRSARSARSTRCSATPMRRRG